MIENLNNQINEPWSYNYNSMYKNISSVPYEVDSFIQYHGNAAFQFIVKIGYLRAYRTYLGYV